MAAGAPWEGGDGGDVVRRLRRRVEGLLAEVGVGEGEAVLRTYGYGTGDVGRYVGYMVLIVFVYRVLGGGVLWVRKH